MWTLSSLSHFLCVHSSQWRRKGNLCSDIVVCHNASQFQQSMTHPIPIYNVSNDFCTHFISVRVQRMTKTADLDLGSERRERYEIRTTNDTYIQWLGGNWLLLASAVYELPICFDSLHLSSSLNHSSLLLAAMYTTSRSICTNQYLLDRMTSSRSWQYECTHTLIIQYWMNNLHYYYIIFWSSLTLFLSIRFNDHGVDVMSYSLLRFELHNLTDEMQRQTIHSFIRLLTIDAHDHRTSRQPGYSI